MLLFITCEATGWMRITGNNTTISTQVRHDVHVVGSFNVELHGMNNDLFRLTDLRPSHRPTLAIVNIDIRCLDADNMKQV